MNEIGNRIEEKKNFLIDPIGVVINYYWKPTFPKSFQLSTWVSLLSLQESGFDKNVVLVDGSPLHDKFIQSKCVELGIEYISFDKDLSYAEGFNIGVRHSKGDYICLMANDVYPSRDLIEKLYPWIIMQDVGCVFPYLSSSDYTGQNPNFVRNPITCEPTLMTLNINLFKRSVLEEVNGIDENYSGSYNDVILMAKIRNKGYRVIQVGGTYVNHLGKITISQGSNYQKDLDFQRFSKEYPQYRAKHGKWQVKHWVKPFAVNKRIALFWWIAQHLPSTRARKFMEWLTIWLEPELTKVNLKHIDGRELID